MRQRDRVARLVRTVGWATIALVAVTLGTLAALPATGRRVLAVTGGSMGTAIPVGSAALVRSVDGPADVTVGDVVTFHRFGGDGLTTHRVVSTHVVGGEPHLRTWGDANDTADPDLVPVDAVVGTVEGSLPRVGTWLLALSRRDVRLALVVVPAVGIAVGQVRILARAAGIAAAVALLAVAGAPGPGTSAAGYTDTAPVGEATFSTGAFP